MTAAREKIGLLTIGQSPRGDLTPELLNFLDEDCRHGVVEEGALDGLTQEEIASLAPVAGASSGVLITRTRDGGFVKLYEPFLGSLLEKKIERMKAEGVTRIVLLCAGQFPQFAGRAELILPDKLLLDEIKTAARGKRLGVITPLPEQMEEASAQYSETGFSASQVAAASPYAADPFAELARAVDVLRQFEAEVLAMDCFGYTMEMAGFVEEKLSVRVLAVRASVGRYLRSACAKA